MKWGVRRYQNKDGSLTPAGQKRSKSLSENDKVKQSRKNDIKSRRTMSDADLKRKIERLKMEKQLKKSCLQQERKLLGQLLLEDYRMELKSQ